jgi:hypothetical protein
MQKSQIMHKTAMPGFIGLALCIIIGFALCIIYVPNALRPTSGNQVKYGYARVSTDGQSVAAQVEQLTQAGAEKIFKEKVSGAVTHRQQLKLALDALDEGDVLLVTRLDRLARSTRDLLNIRLRVFRNVV